MKKILLFCMLLLSAIGGAQVVNIPDANFKNFLVNGYGQDMNNVNIDIDADGDGEIQASEAEAIWKIYIQDDEENPIVSLVGLEAFTNLRNLMGELFMVTQVDCSALLNLEQFNVDFYALETVNLQGLPELHYINCDCGALTSVYLEDLPNLTSINLHTNPGNLTSFTIGYMPGLVTAQLDDSSVPVLDFSNCPQLAELQLASGDLEHLNIKNGAFTYASLTITGGNPYICIDEGEEAYLAEAIEAGAIVNTYCSYTPGGNYNTISGALTFDADNNGCGGSDPLHTSIKVTIDDGTESGMTFSDMDGEYNFFTQAGSFTITPEFENNWFTVTPPSATVNSATVDNSTITENFCITANGVHPDLAVYFIPIEPAQPGFDAIYKIVYRNNGNQILSGDIYFSFDDALTDYLSAEPVEDMTSGNVRGWGYDGLMPFESRNIYVTLNVNSPQETPAVNIDDVLSYAVTCTPTTGDETPADNVVVYNETVIGSYDPNDKTCLEGDMVTPEMIGGYLHYNINFENTGTAPATFIVVKDVINPAQFDISTLQVLNASHDMMVRVDGNTVEFRFDAINLGPLEKGNVLFKIKTLNTLQIGDEVSNFADIFFDYNFPITTNDATTSFEVLGTGDFEIDSSVMIYPNPTNGLVNITADSNLTSLQLFDLQGRLLQTVLLNDTKAALDMTGRATGVYLLKVTSEKGIKVEKIVNE